MEGDLSGEPGIEQVTADVGTRRVRIACDPQRTRPDRLRAKPAEIGYRRTVSTSAAGRTAGSNEQFRVEHDIIVI